MGVKLLNTFLRRLHTHGVEKIHLRELRSKRIVIDASIYMYRFAAMDSLIENMYLLCSILRYYDISALFIFDGPTRSASKYHTIQRRREQREKAISAYAIYVKQLEDADADRRDYITSKMEQLRRHAVKLRSKDMSAVKNLLDAYGIMYRTAKGEADELCAALVIKGHAYACLSEDTDMFAYGCPRVLKYMSLLNHTTICYDLEKILLHVDMKFSEFQELCCVAGTDYNMSQENIFYYYKLFKKYHDSTPPCIDGFTQWLITELKISTEQAEELLKVKAIYNVDPAKVLTQLEYCLIQNKVIDRRALKHILQTDGFVFCK